jgi:hypothetical protein
MHILGEEKMSDKYIISCAGNFTTKEACKSLYRGLVHTDGKKINVLICTNKKNINGIVSDCKLWEEK